MSSLTRSTGSYYQQGCDNVITVVTVHYAADTPIQHVHPIQPGPELYVTDWLSWHNHTENQDQKIPGMNMSINNISTLVAISTCMSSENIWAVMGEALELQMLQRYKISGWPSTKNAIEPKVENYWHIRHELAMIYDIAMKGKCIIIPCLLQMQILEQLHNNHMGNEKMHLLVRESVYWVNMKTDIELTVRQFSTCLEYQCTQPHKAELHYDILCKSSEVVGADVFMTYYTTLTCIVDYYSKTPVVKKGGKPVSTGPGESSQDEIFRVLAAEKNCLWCRNKLDTRNLQRILQKVKHPVIHKIIISPPKQQSSRNMYQMCKIHDQKCTDDNQNTNLALLQIQSTPVGWGLLSPAVMLFNRPIWSLLLQISRAPINIDNDDAQYETLEACKSKYNKNNDTWKTFCLFNRVFSSSRVGGWGATDVLSHKSPVGVTTGGIHTQYWWQQWGDSPQKYKAHKCHIYISKAIPLWLNMKGNGSTGGQAEITNWSKGTNQATGAGPWTRGHKKTIHTLK